MPPRGPMGAAFAKNRPKPKDQGKTIKRLLSYIDTPNKVRLAVVFLCIIVSAIAGVLGSMFLEILIDDYITPLLGESNPVFTGLLQAIGTMGLIYLLGAAATFTYNWLMATVSQGILKDIRNDLFSHMQRLPIKYFDTHTHGDIMSRYTNDTDTLRMLVSQSIPPAVQHGNYPNGSICGYGNHQLSPNSPYAGSGSLHAVPHQKNRRKQRQILCPPAKIPGSH